MKMEAETGGRRPQAQGRLEPPEAGRGGKDPPLEPLEGAQPHQQIDSEVLVSRNGKEQISVVLRPPVVVACYGHPRKLMVSKQTLGGRGDRSTRGGLTPENFQRRECFTHPSAHVSWPPTPPDK